MSQTLNQGCYLEEMNIPEKNMMMLSKGSNNKVKGLPMIHPRVTMKLFGKKRKLETTGFLCVRERKESLRNDKQRDLLCMRK